MNKNFSWGMVMRYCHFVLGIPPSQFWDMTMVEVLELESHVGSNQLITKQDLDNMIKDLSDL